MATSNNQEGRVQNSYSGSEEPTSGEQSMEWMKKRKRMISNRESAKRSRQRKQRQLEDLRTQLWELNTRNDQILSNIKVTTQLYQKIEARNLVLRTQLSELANRLQSLDHIIQWLTESTRYNQDQGLSLGQKQDQDQFGFENNQGLEKGLFWLDNYWTVPMSPNSGLMAYP